MNKTLSIPYQEFSNWQELSSTENQLLNQAKEARLQAYAPYSEFKVGAAILLENNLILKGNNQENAAYPSGLCAERVALFYAKANYPTHKILSIAVVAGKENNTEPVSPCGACRQVLLEYEIVQKTPITFLFSGIKGRVLKFYCCKDFLPFCFDGKLL